MSSFLDISLWTITVQNSRRYRIFAFQSVNWNSSFVRNSPLFAFQVTESCICLDAASDYNILSLLIVLKWTFRKTLLSFQLMTTYLALKISLFPNIFSTYRQFSIYGRFIAFSAFLLTSFSFNDIASSPCWLCCYFSVAFWNDTYFLHNRFIDDCSLLVEFPIRWRNIWNRVRTLISRHCSVSSRHILRIFPRTTHLLNKNQNHACACRSRAAGHQRAI